MRVMEKAVKGVLEKLNERDTRFESRWRRTEHISVFPAAQIANVTES
jgi:hypothetical protein